jgi:hypothetical protein
MHRHRARFLLALCLLWSTTVASAQATDITLAPLPIPPADAPPSPSLPPPADPAQTAATYTPTYPAAPYCPSPPQSYCLVPIVPAPALSEREARRELKRARQREAREAERAEREQRAEQAFLFHREPRVWLYAGLAPMMFAKDLKGAASKRYRIRTAALTLAWRRQLVRGFGLHTALEAGVGATHMGYAERPGSSCCGSISERTGAGFSLGLEAAPWLNPFGGMYLAPGVAVRTLWAPSSSTWLVDETPRDDGEPEKHKVSFRMPLVAVNARLGFGVVFGTQRRLDLGWGLEAGKAFGSAQRTLGLFARLGGAFGPTAASSR